MSLTSENGFQAELVKDTNASGGYAFKASNMYTTGVPDLAVDFGHLPGFQAKLHFKVECKLIKPKKTTRRITTELSVPQEAHLNKTTAAGGMGCWIVGYAFQDCQRWGLFVLHSALGRKHTLVMEDFDNFSMPGHFVKERGKGWPVKNIYTLICDAEINNRRDLYANWKD